MRACSICIAVPYAEQKSNVDRAEADELVERFRAFRAGKTLAGLDIKELIAEGRR